MATIATGSMSGLLAGGGNSGFAAVPDLVLAQRARYRFLSSCKMIEFPSESRMIAIVASGEGQDA